MALSVNVDELVAALSANHIGQDAIDLAALQAQLTKALLVSSSAYTADTRQHCNTPTGRTRAPSLSFVAATDNPCPHHRLLPLTVDDLDLDQDERMVEDLLLMPASPLSRLPPPPPPSDPSSFTATDPFYIAQLQAEQSSFAAQHSPFLYNQYQCA